jgi:hypothetical protein
MSCEIIQFSAAARPARPVSDKRAPRAFLRQGNGDAKESQSSRRRRPKPPKIPESGSLAATLGGLPAG